MACINQEHGYNWTIYHGDSVEVLKSIPDNSIGYSIFSPPFADLYVYSDSERDLGNNKNYDDFWKHFDFIIKELYRILEPGRNISIHCMDLPIKKEEVGYIGIKDFSGDIIRGFQKNDFIYHSRVVIWKDPLIEAVRTKAIGLLYKQLCKDSALSRQGLCDYIITVRKPGENRKPINHDPNDGLRMYQGVESYHPNKIGLEYNHRVWQLYASPVWMDIRQTNTLQSRKARQEEDEKHISPLQLDVLHRCLLLWTNSGDIVLDPFSGIGSTGYKCLELDRKYIGIELKKSYYNESVLNMKCNEKKINNKLL